MFLATPSPLACPGTPSARHCPNRDKGGLPGPFQSAPLADSGCPLSVPLPTGVTVERDLSNQDPVYLSLIYEPSVTREPRVTSLCCRWQRVCEQEIRPLTEACRTRPFWFPLEGKVPDKRAGGGGGGSVQGEGSARCSPAPSVNPCVLHRGASPLKEQ